MTDQRRDAEAVIREWLADSAPDRAPASLKETLEDATSRPPGRTRPWTPGRVNLRIASRLAAAAALLAIAGSGVYFLGTFRATAPGVSPTIVGRPTATTHLPTASPGPQSTVMQLPDSSWKLVSVDFPPVRADFSNYKPPVFALSSGGFVAFLPTVASRKTFVYQSADGVGWRELSTLPGDLAWVDAVTESGGLVIAVGRTGDTPLDSVTAWTTSDLRTWETATLPAPEGFEALGVEAGPGGFLAWGLGGTTMLWISSNGTDWHSLATAFLPEEAGIDRLVRSADGYAIVGTLYAIQGNPDRPVVWRSADGSSWTQVWQGPAPASLADSSTMGPIVKAPDGTYVSFGAATEGGGPSALPYDLQLWTSPDAIDWTKSDRVARPGWIYDFAAVPGGYVAAGQTVVGDGSQIPAPYGPLGVWTSGDGRTWQALTGLPSVGAVQVVSVVGDGTHTVVAFVDQEGILRLLVGSGI